MGLLAMAAMFTIYEAAREAREFFKRENERYRKEQVQSRSSMGTEGGVS